jgi:hypothetical protein
VTTPSTTAARLLRAARAALALAWRHFGHGWMSAAARSP